MMMMMMMMMMTSPFRKGCDLGVWSTIRGYCAGVPSFCRLMHKKKKRKKKKRNGSSLSKPLTPIVIHDSEATLPDV